VLLWIGEITMYINSATIDRTRYKTPYASYVTRMRTIYGRSQRGSSRWIIGVWSGMAKSRADIFHRTALIRIRSNIFEL